MATTWEQVEGDLVEEGEYPQQQALALTPTGTLSVEAAVDHYLEITRFVRSVMKPGVDYGVIPGTQKPTLYKPGAEKLARFHGMQLTAEIVKQEEGWGTLITELEFPLFYYQAEGVAWRDGKPLFKMHGSQNSYDEKYRWRWVDKRLVPKRWNLDLLDYRESSLIEPQFAINGKETTGKYGKPPEYWQMWDDAIENGKATRTVKKKKDGGEMEAWRIDSQEYRIPNTDVYSQINTILKMAEKRAIVAVALVATTASEFFTQDLEDTERNLAKVGSPGAFVPTPLEAKQYLIRTFQPMGLTPADIGAALLEADVTFDLNRWGEILEIVQRYAAKKGKGA